MMTTRVLLLAGVCVLTLCVPVASHAARCPAVEAGNATCAALCPDTVNCPSSQKCCSNGCGHVCMTPTGRTTVIVQLTTDFPWKNEYSTRWGQATIRYILSVTIAQFQKELSHEYLDNPDSPTPDFNLVKDGNRVAVQMAFSHTDSVSRPEVVESRIAWLLAQEYKTIASLSSSYVIDNIKAIVRSTSGQKLSVKILSVCSIFNAKATCRHGGICVNNDGFPACRCTNGYSGGFCETRLIRGHSDSDDHEDSRGFHTGKSDSGGSHDSDGEDRDHGSNEDSGDGSRPQLPQPPQLPAWLGGHGGNGSGWFPSFPGFPSFPPQVPTSHPGPSRCQPKRATECIHRLQTSIERAKLPKSTRGSLEALCRKSNETARCLINSTNGCNSKIKQQFWKPFLHLTEPLNTVCTNKSTTPSSKSTTHESTTPSSKSTTRPSRCQPQRATKCIDSLKTSMSLHHITRRSLEALCRKSNETARCLINSTNGCSDTKQLWKQFFALTAPLNTVCAKLAARTPTVPTTTTDRSTTPSSKSTTHESTTPSSKSTTRSTQVVLVVRLAMAWKDSYKDKDNEETKDLITNLEDVLGDIYSHLPGYRHVQVQRLFRSSVGVQHVAVFDHDLSDAEHMAIGLTLTSALETNNDTLTLGNEKVRISGKTEMLVAGEEVEVTDACFLYNKKQLCQNGGTCVASQTSASCVCASGFAGFYCGTTKPERNNSTGIAVGIVVAVILVVAIVVCAMFVYRRRQQLSKNEHMQLGGVENPVYSAPQGVDNPTYAG